MKLIKYINDFSFGFKTSNQIDENWNIRQAMRAVLFNQNKQIALMYIAKYDVYKLPGGGVDRGENLKTALVREIKEETGCQIKASNPIGIVIEKRNRWKMFQLSYCFIAKTNGVGENLKLTEEEKEAGFSLHWVNSIDTAIKLINKNQSNRYDDKYIKARESAILQTAKQVLRSKSSPSTTDN